MTLLEKEFDVHFILVAFAASFLGLYASVGIAEQLRLSLIDERNVHGSEVRISRQKIHLLYIIICSFGLGTVGVWGSFYVSLYSLHLYDSDGTQYHLSIDSGVQILNFFLITIIVISALLISSYDDMFSKSKYTIINEFIVASKALTLKEIRTITLRKLLITVATKRLGRILVGGFLGGASVLAIIFIGMHGVVFDGHIHYDLAMIVIAVLVIMSSSFTGYWVFFRLLSIFPEFEWLRLSVAILGSITTSAGNYIILYSAQFYKDNSKIIKNIGISKATWDMDMSFNLTFIVSTILLWIITVYAAASARFFLKRQGDFFKRSEEVVFKLAYDFRVKLPPNRLPEHVKAQSQQLQLQLQQQLQQQVSQDVTVNNESNETHISSSSTKSSVSKESTVLPSYTVYPTRNSGTKKLVEQYLATRCGPETWQLWQQQQESQRSDGEEQFLSQQQLQHPPGIIEAKQINNYSNNNNNIPPPQSSMLPPRHMPSDRDTEQWKQRLEQVDMSFTEYLIHLGYLLFTGQFRKSWVAITLEFCPEMPQSIPVSSSYRSSSSFRPSFFSSSNTMNRNRVTEKKNATLPTLLESGLNGKIVADEVRDKNHSHNRPHRKVLMSSRRVIPVESSFKEEITTQHNSIQFNNNLNIQHHKNYSESFPKMEIAAGDRGQRYGDL